MFSRAMFGFRPLISFSKSTGLAHVGLVLAKQFDRIYDMLILVHLKTTFYTIRFSIFPFSITNVSLFFMV